jgi:hypothetical protein
MFHVINVCVVMICSLIITHSFLSVNNVLYKLHLNAYPFLYQNLCFCVVEKGAAVFSLKLDTGHKLLCPWIDNICDESLALFPPTPSPVLVENYYECFSSLLRTPKDFILFSGDHEKEDSPTRAVPVRTILFIGCP